jgi:sugar lactone lactonase YvrE
MIARTVRELGADGAVLRTIEVDDVPSGIGFVDDAMLVVAMRTQRILGVKHGAIYEHADLTPLGGAFLNDMVVSPGGTAYVGLRKEVPRATEPEQRNEAVVVVNPDGSTRLGSSGMAGPNGSVLTPDGRYLLVAETFGERVSQFEILEDGGLGKRTTYAHVPGAHPDGICLDATGAVWVASPQSHAFLRVAQGGEVISRITVGSKWAIACVFGGADRRTLFLLAADVPEAAQSLMFASVVAPGPADPSAIKELRRLGLSGGVYTFDVDVPGAGIP